MFIGVFQDRIFSYLDRKFFPFKYQTKNTYQGSNNLKTVSGVDGIIDFVISILTWVFLGVYLLLMVNEISPFLAGLKPLSFLFGDTLWTVHFVFGLILIYQGYNFYQKMNKIS